MPLLDQSGASEALVQPLRWMPPLLSLALIALLTAAGLLLLFRATSNQQRIAATKRRIQAGLFEIRLFNDDPRTILQAQKNILRSNVEYLRLSAAPMLWMVVPFLVLVAQLQSLYGYVALQPGEAFHLELQLREDRLGGRRLAPRPDVQLHVPPGLQAETQDLWIPMLSELVWRIRAERPGRYVLEVQLGNEHFAKEVRVAEGLGRLSPVRQQGFLARLLYPVEKPLPSSAPIRSVRVSYAARGIPVLGWRLPWMAVFFPLVFLFTFALKTRFRVTI